MRSSIVHPLRDFASLWEESPWMWEGDSRDEVIPFSGLSCFLCCLDCRRSLLTVHLTRDDLVCYLVSSRSGV